LLIRDAVRVVPGRRESEVAGPPSFCGFLHRSGPMRILCSPVLVGDRICRVVSPIASLIEVEEWVGAWWEPSAVTITTATQAPPASAALLLARGVPLEDQAGESPATLLRDVQSMLRASAPQDSQPVALDPANERRPNGSRRKQFAGNARFRRGRSGGAAGPGDQDQRERPSAAEWSGPWRRAADDPSPRGPTAG